jgi:thiol-disulfide isomerase/thioredoxin
LLLAIDHYDSLVTAVVGERGRRLDGDWRKTTGPAKQARLAFHAVAGGLGESPASNAAAVEPIVGRWSVDFESDDEPAVAIFSSGPSGEILGTFLTTTGDYRYLAGTYEEGRLRLSCFDGAHAFLFDARLAENGTLAGDFWSRDSWHDTWTARRDPHAAMPDAFELTRWVGGKDLDEMTFPDLDGRPRSLGDAEFAGRARILEVFGSWCPNCNDAAAYLAELHREYGPRGLSIVGLAFEMTGEFERDAEQVRRYAKHHGLQFPLLVAGVSDKALASESFPLLDRIRSYPTTIFLHADGRLRAVHQGFAGPATGKAHEELRARFRGLIEELLAES